ncbi:MAG: hypothetical protein HOK54_00425, partial [Alphaproteobacteria bacterium]|nr:hypothetical protein [Alphaproteobacteria bacterium]
TPRQVDNAHAFARVPFQRQAYLCRCQHFDVIGKLVPDSQSKIELGKTTLGGDGWRVLADSPNAAAQ